MSRSRPSLLCRSPESYCSELSKNGQLSTSGVFFSREKKMEEYGIHHRKMNMEPQKLVVWVDVFPFSKGACSGSMLVSGGGGL